MTGIGGGNGEGGNCGTTHGPQFPTVHAVIGSEVQGAAHYSQVLGVGARGTGADVAYQNRTRLRAVAFPQFPTVHAVIGSEEQGIAHCGQILGVETTKGIIVTGVDILDQNCTGRRAVALPQFSTVHAVKSSEEQGVAHRRHLGEEVKGATGTGAYIFDQNRTSRRAVAFPQFLTVHAVKSTEKEGITHRR
ncbi:hypothetical protein MiYa_04605 [Microcystis aeruginosa NIES-2519]|uniref:Uncharacterized protein n=1 Tax=Microcystis aeruginosa NIES-2519 TaxID=2303981 RepID=A0A5A5RL07_MICAE|nr:hypothetical protein MiYa_04605 [Microcystis aeruginosa NIES-2519]